MTINTNNKRVSPRIKQLETIRDKKRERAAKERAMGPGKFEQKTVLRKKTDNDT